MNGKELFELKTIRDYSGSEADEYAQLLATVFFNVGSDIFPILETAENEGKRISVLPINANILRDEILLADIVLIDS